MALPFEMDAVLKDRTNYEFQWKLFLRQFVLSSIIWVTFLNYGFCLGTPTVAVPQLRKEANNTSEVSDEMASWISSIAGYAAIICIIGLVAVSHSFGRKKAILIVLISNLIAFIILYFSRNATDILISHIFHGLSSATIMSVSLLVLAECSSPRYRGLFLTIKSASMFWGIWIANAIGTFFDYRNIAICGITCSVYSIVAFMFLPETPLWLATREKYEECEKSYRFYRGVDDQTEKELLVLLNDQKQRNIHEKRKKCVRDHFNEIINDVKSPEIYKPMAIALITSATYFFSGKLVYTIYSIQMIKKITGSESAAYIGMLILDGFSISGMYIGCGLSKIIKRRKLLLSTYLVGIFFMYVISIYLYLVKFSIITENPYVSISLLTGYSLAICSGPMILPSSIYAEIVPIKSRNLFMCPLAIFNLFVVGSLLKTAPYLFYKLGFHGIFLLYALLSTGVVILIYYFVPETKDKSVYEIINLFKKDKNADPTELDLLNKTDLKNTTDSA